MPADADHVILNVNVLDTGITYDSWYRNDLDPLAFVDIDYWQRVGQIAERGTLDAYFLADGPGLRADPRLRPARAFEPSQILAAVAQVTENLGLIGTLSTTFNEPWELAQRLQSLDYISGGRVAWNIVTTRDLVVADNFGLPDLPDRDARYRRAGEFVDVVSALWATTVGGPAVEHKGEFFELSGRLPVPASAQGHPLLVQAGGSPAGRELAGRTAHAVFSAEISLQAGIEHYRQVKAYAVAAGRDPAQIKILPGLITTIASSEEEARRRHEEALAVGPDNFTIEALAASLGVPVEDLGDLDSPLPQHVVDGPPDPRLFTASLGFREAIVRLAVDDKLTVRQLQAQMSAGFGHRKIIGTPEQVADTIDHWFRAGAADGFNLMPDRFPDGLEIFVDEVIPILRSRGLFRHEYEAPTLRERFGVPLLATA